MYQLQSARHGNDVAKNLRREAVTHKAVVDGMMSLSAALGQFVVWRARTGSMEPETSMTTTVEAGTKNMSA